MAWNLLKTLGIDFPESCTKGTYEFLYTLAWKIGRGCGKEEYKAFGKYLVSVGKSQGGVDEGIFSEVANGFKLRSVDGRQNCMKIYQELASCDGGSEAISVLLQEAQDENSMQDARLAALHVLSELDPGINLSKDMVSALVSLCATREVAVRTAALECLRPGLDFEIPTVEILEKYLEDKDSSVRLAALKSIGKGPHFRRAYIQCLNDEASVVVQIALDLLSNFDSHQEEICPHLTPLLQHGDSQVRRMVAEYLGEMTSAASRAEALRALEADTPWSETKDEVRGRKCLEICRDAIDFPWPELRQRPWGQIAAALAVERRTNLQAQACYRPRRASLGRRPWRSLSQRGQQLRPC
eukprot:symbB.v1.2.009967.t1/scaffold623.1/size335370/10